MSEHGSAFVPQSFLLRFFVVCPLAAAVRSLSEGLAIGLGTALICLVLGLLAPPLRSLVPERLRFFFFLALSSGTTLLYGLALEYSLPAVAAGLGVYLPLLMVNELSLKALRQGTPLPSNTSAEAECSRQSRFAALAIEALMYLAFVIVFGAIRELAGLASLSLPWPDMPRIRLLPVPPLPMLVAPAGGFMLLGGAAALYKVWLRLRGRRSL